LLQQRLLLCSYMVVRSLPVSPLRVPLLRIIPDQEVLPLRGALRIRLFHGIVSGPWLLRRLLIVVIVALLPLRLLPPVKAAVIVHGRMCSPFGRMYGFPPGYTTVQERETRETRTGNLEFLSDCLGAKGRYYIESPPLDCGIASTNHRGPP
jgi:hypothetical protein